MADGDEHETRPEAPQTEPAGGTSRRAVVLGSAAAIAGATSGCALFAQPPPVSRADEPTPPGAPLSRGQLEGKVALVTGAARGIGRAICIACAREGAEVVGVDLAGPVSPAVRYPPATRADFAETERLVQVEQRRRFLPVVADMRDGAAMRDAVTRTIATFGHLDVLVVNAGIYVPLTLSEMTDQAWRDVIDVNLTGAANSLRAVIPHMTERQEGRIIAVSSVLGRVGVPIGPQYNASKWGLIGLVKSAALELGPSGIRVNAVCPTAVNTVMLRNDFQYQQMLPWPGQPPERIVAGVGRLAHPLQVPFIEPEDVAAVVVFLASEEARFVSGAAYDVTAGIGPSTRREGRGPGFLGARKRDRTRPAEAFAPRPRTHARTVRAVSRSGHSPP